MLASAFPQFHATEIEQLSNYISLYRHLGAQELYKVNDYIDEKEMWDDFDFIRAKNTHANGSEVKGISPKFYKACCEVLNIGKGKGTALVKSKTW